jgi:HlyD family secretion protein
MNLERMLRMGAKAWAARRGGKVLWITMAAVVALLIIGGALAGAMRTSNADTSTQGKPDWYSVQKQSFELTVIASGELEAKQQVEIKSEVKGDPVIIDVVDEGVAVKKGDVLLRLATDEIADKIEQETLDVEGARADKVAAQQTLEIEKNEAESTHRAAEVKFLLAKLELEKWKNGDLQQTRRELDLALIKGKRQLERAKTDVQMSRELYEQKFISRSEMEDDELAEIEAQEALNTAELNIDVYEKYTYQKELQQFQSDVDQAEAELARTISKNESNLARLQSDLDSKTRTLAIRESRLAELRDQLAKTVIAAPQDGLVVYATSIGPNSRRGNPIAVGRQVRFNETIIILPDTRQMVAAVRVHEALMPQVREQQPASVTIDARPNESIAGTVVSLSVMAEDGGWLNPQLREYKVKVELPPQTDGTLKPAMRCAAKIHVGEINDALAVPVQAVFTDGKQQFCYVPAGSGRVVKLPVVAGRASEALVEITEGLTLGSQVLLRQPRPGEVQP